MLSRFLPADVTLALVLPLILSEDARLLYPYTIGRWGGGSSALAEVVSAERGRAVAGVEERRSE